MKIKDCKPFLKQKENIEYIESLCKRYLQFLNAEAEFLENDNYKFLLNESRITAELKRVGKSLRLATIELEKRLKWLESTINIATKKLLWTT